ncbi:MAG: HAD-IIA family hydrolase [Propionibacteriaceae bacterium]|jgi:HAD superfamily hydrolase (TIGR01450 family)|nr:HAD-IIA family hydrolase [Propionibacteriaceae bacterium]
MSLLIDAYDAALFDLDGVIYLGPLAVPGAVDGIAELEARKVPIMYVTNNAAPTAESVVEKLDALGYPARYEQVLTSAQVAARYLPEELELGSKILIAGSPNLAEVMRQAGYEPVYSADDQPQAVIQGYFQQMPWPMLDEACLAIERGAKWYACNDDTNRPTDRGTVPGVGGMIAVLTTALGGKPKTFGKPFRPMMDEAARRAGATRPIFVGDRLDTDIEGANNAGIDSLLVFSGVHGKRDLVNAKRKYRPTHIGRDVRALTQPARELTLVGGSARCGNQSARVEGERIVIDSSPVGYEQQLDALWAVANLAWAKPGVSVETALDMLSEVR